LDLLGIGRKGHRSRADIEVLVEGFLGAIAAHLGEGVPDRQAKAARSAHRLHELLLTRLVQQLLDDQARQLDAVGEIEDGFAALDAHEFQHQAEQVARRDPGRGNPVWRRRRAMNHRVELLFSQMAKRDEVCAQAPAMHFLVLQRLGDRGRAYKLAFDEYFA
jgi:hypothetical protein